MWRVTLLLLLIQRIASEDDINQECSINRSKKNMFEYKLIKDIRNCGYNLFTPPRTNGSSPLKVRLKLIMKNFKFDSQNQEFSALMWLMYFWKDDRLHWDPSKYGGVDSLVLSTAHMWAPRIRHINEIGDNWDRKYWFAPCEVKNGGRAHCVARVVYTAKCGTDLKDWPYDAQKCKFAFGTYHEEDTKIQLDVKISDVSMIMAGYGSQWDITDYQRELDMNSETQMIVTYKLERHGDVLAATVIYPAFIVTALTVLPLFLDARKNLRLFLLCFSLMCHYDFLSNMSWNIPENTKDPPRLLLYYRGSFIITNLLLVQSIIIKFMCKKKGVCPDWITSVNDFVFMKLPKFVIWPRWGTKVDEDVSTSNFARDWTDFANIINSVWIVVLMVVYVSLYCVYIPHPIPFKYT